MVTAQSIVKQKKELLNLLRNSDIINTTIRGVTTTTDEFDGDTVETDFVLTHAGVKNIRSVTVDTVTLSYGKDYNITENDSAITTVTFTTAPGSGTDNVDIQYDYGVGDKIFDDFPKDTVTIKTFPSIGFDILSSKTNEISLSGAAYQSNKLIQISAYAEKGETVEELIDSIRQVIFDSGDSLYYWNFIEPDSIGPTLNVDIRGGKIFQRNIDLRAQFEFEGTTC